MNPDPDETRGIRYADGGVGWGTLAYPDPERKARFDREWESVTPPKEPS